MIVQGRDGGEEHRLLVRNQEVGGILTDQQQAFQRQDPDLLKGNKALLFILTTPMTSSTHHVSLELGQLQELRNQELNVFLTELFLCH